MLKRFEILGVVVLVLFLAVAFSTEHARGIQNEIAGLIGVNPATENSCIAIWIPIESGMALNGVSWYNNDGTVAFPQVLLQSGTADSPLTLDEAQVVAEETMGESSGWSSVQFAEPFVCSSEGLYVIFKMPVGSQIVAEGPQGGAAIGYIAEDNGHCGWISADGQDWTRIAGEYGFALTPEFIEGDSDMSVMKSLGQGDQDSMPVTVTMLHPAAPNPFNPMTTLRFSLKNSCNVDLSIYNVKGELVKHVVQQYMDAGNHEAVWNGRDHTGSPLASGVYFGRFVADHVVMTQRLVLIQ